MGAKVLLSKDLGQLSLAHTSGANQQQRSTGAVGVLQTHTSPAGPQQQQRDGFTGWPACANAPSAIGHTAVRGMLAFVTEC